MSMTQQIIENQNKIMHELGELKGILIGSNGEGHEGRLEALENNQNRYVTFRVVMILIGMWTAGFGGLTLFAKLAGLW